MTTENPDLRTIRTGKVYLVGAGPGDPRLITVRGLECLRRADCVLYDGLVNAALLDLAPKAEKTCVGKHGKSPIWDQSDINQEIVRQAKAGKMVIRLKGGDPAVFARTAEELAALQANNIPFEVVPGITAALAVAGYAGIPLTHRDYSSAVALVTGQQQEQAPSDIDWQALAKFPGTLSVYMGVTTARNWTDKLIQGGKSADTPVAIVRRCSWSDQQVVLCKLSEVADHLTPSTKMRPPVLVVIGQVAHLGQSWNWFQQQPLFGFGIWIPRAAHQSSELIQMLTDLGANVIAEPVLRVVRPSSTTDLQNAVQMLRDNLLQGITFSSTNGVDGLLNYVFEQGHDARLLAGVKLAAVGPATSDRLRQYGLHADISPRHEFNAESLLACLDRSVAHQHWLVTTTNRGRSTIALGLRELEAMVTECLSYETIPIREPGPQLAEALEADQVKLALITSSAIGEMAKQLLGSKSHQVLPIALSQTVAQTLGTLGWLAVRVAKNNTTDSLVHAALDYIQSSNGSEAIDSFNQ